MDVIACFKYVCFSFSKQQFYFFIIHGVRNNITPRFKQPAVNLVLAMSALSKRQSFSFLFTLPLHFLVGVAFLATSFLVLEAFLAERLVACTVDCRADGEAWTDFLADGLSMPDH
jgi:hypothetical protein